MKPNDNLNIFDSSFLTSEKHHDLSKEELIQELVPKIENILKERFPGNPQRQKVKIFKDRLAFAAPCCGDSAYVNSKKRGNIILDGQFKNMYKCHNCGCHMSMYNFFKRFKNPLSLQAVDYIIQNKNTRNYNVETSYDSSINLLFDTEIIDEYAIDREYFKEKCHLEECDCQNSANLYLINRAQTNFDKFLYHKKYNLLFILNLTAAGKIIGVQVRNLNKFFKEINKIQLYTSGKWAPYRLKPQAFCRSQAAAISARLASPCKRKASILHYCLALSLLSLAIVPIGDLFGRIYSGKSLSLLVPAGVEIVSHAIGKYLIHLFKQLFVLLVKQYNVVFILGIHIKLEAALCYILIVGYYSIRIAVSNRYAVHLACLQRDHRNVYILKKLYAGIVGQRLVAKHLLKACSLRAYLKPSKILRLAVLAGFICRDDYHLLSLVVACNVVIRY